MPVEDVVEAKRRKPQAIHQDLKKPNNARDDDDGWFSCSEDEDDQEEEEEEEVQWQEKKAPEEKVEADVEAATTFPPTVKPFASSMGSTGAPQQEHVEEGEELQKVMAWLTANRLGHAREPRELGVGTLEDLALDVEAAKTFPQAVKPFALPMGSTGAPQQEHVEEGEELQKLKAWLTSYRLGHV